MRYIVSLGRKKKPRKVVFCKWTEGRDPSSKDKSDQSMAPGDIDSSADFHQLVQAHQAVAARLPPLEEIHTLLDRSTRGMLSTFSQFDEAADRYSFMAKMLGISWID